MARLTPEQWEAIRSVWEYDPDEPSHEVAATRAGKKYQFKPPSKSNVCVKCIKDSWERRGNLNGINAAAHRKADAMVDANGNPTKQNDQNEDTQKEQNHVLNPAALVQASRIESEDKRAEVTARHRQEWAQVAILRQEGLQMRSSDPVRCSEKLRQAKIAAEVTAIQQQGERKAWGLDVIVDPASVKNLTDAEIDAILAGHGVTPRV